MQISSVFHGKFQAVTNRIADMVLLNIGAFIAWGLLSAIFLPSGWFPVPAIAKIITPFGHYLLPLLVAYTGGQAVYEQRGGVVGAVTCIGAIVGSNYLAILPAMICGPIAGWCLKKWDNFLRPHVKQGFEMIVNNLSSGIMGMLLILGAFYIVDPIVNVFNDALAIATTSLIARHLLPLANIVIEPAKVFFLNNAINSGVLTPMGVEQAVHGGKSILFLLETNPGPGLGILTAVALFGHGASKKSAPGAALIEAIGGIHEIYFPYVIMQPMLFLAVIAGGVSGTFTFSLFDAGLKSAASPGSLITILLLTPRGFSQFFAVLAGIAVSTVVSFIVAVPFVHRDMVTGPAMVAADAASVATTKHPLRVIFAGTEEMGSPAIGAHVFSGKLAQGGTAPNIKLSAMVINQIQPEPGDIIITKTSLLKLVRTQVGPDQEIITVDNFIRNDVYSTLIARLRSQA
ncbi:PTS mannitol transporter subunit IICB [Lacticaseibacillus zhaodongensis]|uniref:PTS mannitol transporter subunit IICB n=1 Tax=Lacticaseibacillus zhaodongensis TaxID=2668065 RepID=UPI0012D33758|nr:PTS mannitol transporter subunit IICB [Lacticaseibacillus zhaodongensis]